MNKKIEVVQQGFEAFGRGDIPGILALLHDDVQWTDPGYPDIPYAGVRRGKSEVPQFFEGLGKALTFERFETPLFLNDGDYVIVKGFCSGTSNETGKPFATETLFLWEVKDDKVVSYQAFLDTNNIARCLQAVAAPEEIKAFDN